MATADDNEPRDGDVDRIGTEPIDGDGRYPFAGLTRYDDNVDAVTLPEGVWGDTSSMRFWAQNKTNHSFADGAGTERDLSPEVLPERGLATLIPDLPRATAAEVRWVHPRTGETIGTMKHNAVIDPDKAERIGEYGNVAEAVADMTGHDLREVREFFRGRDHGEALEELATPEQRERISEMMLGDEALFNIPTRDYQIINPSSFMYPLTEVIQDRGWGDKVFGELELSRGGGRASIDLYVDGQHVESPVFDDDREPVVVGLNIQWDFFGNWAVRATGQALDWRCTNQIHRLTDREIVKHAGDVEGRQNWYDWFDNIFDRIDAKRDQLSRIIEAAANETLDFSDLPNDIEREFEDADAAPWTALYAYMGLPDYLAEHAGRRLRSESDDAYRPNWWDIHSAATYAVTHHARGDRSAGGSWDDYAQTANDMLFNPAQMEDRVVANYEADRMSDDQSNLDAEGGGVADIRTAFETTREKKERFEQWEADIKEMGIEL